MFMASRDRGVGGKSGVVGRERAGPMEGVVDEGKRGGGEKRGGGDNSGKQDYHPQSSKQQKLSRPAKRQT